MRWLLPHPVFSAALLAMWLLLAQSAAPGPVLVGAVLALLGGWSLTLLEPRRARPRRPWLRQAALALRLAADVAADILRSNLAVALVILVPRKARRTGFIRVPLRLRDPRALAALACILTATPGTAWVEFDTRTGELLLHVLDLVDEAHWVEIIQHRYERPLMEMFQ